MRPKMILLSVSFVMLFSVYRNEDEPTLPVCDSRMVLIYAMAQNSLFPFARLDMEEMIKEMKQAGTTSSDLLICIGDYPTLHLVHLGKSNKGQVMEEMIVNYPEQSSAGVAVMKRVISTASSTYKAKSYGMGFWSHGEGWIPSPAETHWSGQDGNGYVNMDDLHGVLQVVPKLDSSLFDACFVESVEMAHVLCDCGDYVTSSPTEASSVGAPHEGVVPAMLTAGDPTMKIVSAYYTCYENRYNNGVGLTNENWTGGVSVGVAKMNELKNLAIAIAKVLPKYMAGEADFDLSEVICYDRRYLALYHDLDQYIYKLTVGNGDYDAWKTAFDRIMVYQKSTPHDYSAYVGMLTMDSKTKGLFIYIPMTNGESTSTSYQGARWYKAFGRIDTGWYR